MASPEHVSMGIRSEFREEAFLLNILRGKALTTPPSLDWERLRYIAHRHGLIVQLQEKIEKVHFEAPQTFKENLKLHFLKKLSRAQPIIKEVLALNRLFQEAQIRGLFYKGPALSQLLHQNVTARPSVDVDVLIPERVAESVILLLVANGYAPQQRGNVGAILKFCCEYSLMSPLGVQVEIHWKVLPPRWGFRANFQEWLKRSTHVQICGHAIPTPGHEDLLYALVGHAAKHRWESWKMIYDLHLLCQRDLNWDLILRQATNSGFLRVLRVSLELAQLSFGLVLPARIQCFIDADMVAKRLSERVFQDLLNSTPPDGGWRRRVFELQLKERRTDRCRFAIQSLLGPGLRDISYYEAVGANYPLYYLTRLHRCFASLVRALNARRERVYE